MRSVVSRLGLAGVAGSFGVWGATVGGYAATQEFSPWPYSWLWIVALVFVVSGVVWILAELPPRDRRRGPDFKLTRRDARMWEIERVRPVIALNVRQGDGIIGTTDLNIVGLQSIGDFKPGEQKIIAMPNDTECLVPFAWTETSGNYFSKSVRVTPTVDHALVTGIAYEPGDVIQT
jgi:hypothetical protein